MIHQISDNTRHKNQEMGSNGFLNKTRFLHFHSTQSWGNYHQQVAYLRTSKKNQKEGVLTLKGYGTFVHAQQNQFSCPCQASPSSCGVYKLLPFIYAQYFALTKLKLKVQFFANANFSHFLFLLENKKKITSVLQMYLFLFIWCR